MMLQPNFAKRLAASVSEVRLGEGPLVVDFLTGVRSVNWVDFGRNNALRFVMVIPSDVVYLITRNCQINGDELSRVDRPVTRAGEPYGSPAQPVITDKQAELRAKK